MDLPTPTQWERFSLFRERLEPLADDARRAELRAMHDAHPDDMTVVSLVALHFAMPVPGPDGIQTGDCIDEFVLGELLGAGGMGVVYEATQSLGETSRPVAIKLIRPLLWGVAPEETRKRFADEIKAQAVLQYDGLARLYTAGSYTDPATQIEAPYLVMELVRGARTITDFARERRLDVTERLRLFQRVCRAVQHAHDYRIVHRDLKPANILVDSEGQPFVVDFGLAQTCDVVLPGAAIVASGTPAYMSPEQLLSAFGPVSGKTDTYALGVVLYEMLAGCQPYRVSLKDSLERLTRVITEEPPQRLSDHAPELGEELEAIVMSALSKDPKNRPDIGALGAQLESHLRSQEQSAPAMTLPGPSSALVSTRRVAATRSWVSLSFAVLALMGLGMAFGLWKFANSPGVPEPSVASIAVLPFRDLGSEEEQAIFVDGIHDDLITQFGKLRDLKVIARRSVMMITDDMAPEEIATTLGVARLMEGSVRFVDNQARVNVQLIDPRTNTTLWSESFDRDFTAQNIFGIQSDIVRAVAAELGATLRLEDEERLDRAPTENTEAYRLYQLARRKAADLTMGGAEESIDLFEVAIALDSNFADAYALLGRSYLRLGWRGDAPEDAVDKAREYIDRALDLDPTSAEALTALGQWLEWHGQEDWVSAEAVYKRAVELNPNSFVSYQILGTHFRDTARMEEALEAHLKALEIDPLRRDARIEIAMDLQELGRSDEMLTYLQPDDPSWHLLAGLRAWYLGDYVRAVEHHRKYFAKDERRMFSPCILTWIFAELGWEQKATEWFETATRVGGSNRYVHETGVWYHRYVTRDEQKAVEYAKAQLSQEVVQGWEAQRILALHLIRHGHPEQAVESYEQRSPKLFETPPRVDRLDLMSALDLVWVLQQTGNHDHADALIDVSLERLKTIPRLGFFGASALEAQAYALRGNKQRALQELRRAVDDGVRYGWRHAIETAPQFEALRAEPQYQLIVTELQAEMAEQRRLIAAAQGIELLPRE